MIIGVNWIYMSFSFLLELLFEVVWFVLINKIK